MLDHRPKRVLLTTISSDSHTWNLVFLHLLLEEHGHHVTNLGACPPDDLVLARCLTDHPDLLVISSVNGHATTDGHRLITRLRAEPALHHLPAVIGGKLGIAGPNLTQAANLVEAGFDAVFTEDSDLSAFARFVATPTRRALEGSTP